MYSVTNAIFTLHPRSARRNAGERVIHKFLIGGPAAAAVKGRESFTPFALIATPKLKARWESAIAVLFLKVAMIRVADTPGLWSGRRSC